MASNWELQLITAILEEQDLDTPKRVFGIEPHCFISSEASMLYQEIDRFWNNKKHYGQVPPFSWISDKFPSTTLPDPETSIEVLCEFVQDGYTRRRLMDFSDRLYELSETSDDLEDAIEYLVKESKNVASVITPGRDLDFGASALEAIKHEINMIEESGGLKGHPWPWDAMNRTTGGLENGSLYAIYGRPGTMKTWIMLYAAVHLYVHYGLRVLVWCKETPPEMIRTRVATLIGKLSFTRYQKGQLTLEEKDRLFEALEVVLEDEKDSPGGQKLMITSGDASAASTVAKSIAALRSKAEEYRPQAIFCDSFYHAQSSVKWQDVTNLIMQLKDLAMEQKVPILCTWQANRMTEKSGKGAKAGGDMALGDALVREADMLIRLYLHAGDTEEDTLLSFDIPKSRSYWAKGFTIHGVPGHNFDWYSDEVYYNRDSDDEEKPGKKGQSKSGKKFEGMSAKPSDEWDESEK